MKLLEKENKWFFAPADADDPIKVIMESREKRQKNLDFLSEDKKKSSAHQTFLSVKS